MSEPADESQEIADDTGWGEALASAVRQASGLETVVWDDTHDFTRHVQVRRNGVPVETMTVVHEAILREPMAEHEALRWNERVLAREFAPIIEAMEDYLWAA